MINELYQKYLASAGVNTDTRKLAKGEIFFALKGGNFNGNEYADQALESGAIYAVVDEWNTDKENDSRYIRVDDVLQTLQELARHHRRQFKIPILAITGSNGKTTTKELIAEVLSTTYNVWYTLGNLNNHIGVPLTLLSMKREIDIAVIEMGANHPNEIDFLCRIAEPTHGLVTNVGRAHLEGFGGFAGVIKTKGELYEYLSEENKVAFVNARENHLLKMSQNCQHRIPYGGSNRVENKGANPFVEVEWSSREDVWEVQTQLIGVYNFNNILTAITIGQYFKVNDDKIKRALEQYQPKNNRSQLEIRGSNQLIMDAYNANPTSMEAALRNFSNMEGDGKKKIVVLGDMLELGKESFEEHQRIYELALSFGFSKVITVGKEFAQVTNKEHYTNIESLLKYWDWTKITDSLLLIKGSRGIRLEKLLSE